MALRNTSDDFGWAARTLHWVSAAGVAAMFAIAWWMDALPIGLLKLQAYGWHKSLGLTILAVTLVRLGWRLGNAKPRHLGRIAWQRRVSDLAHAALYAGLIAMPVIGWLMSAAANTPVNLFGLFVLPNPIPADKTVAAVLEAVHAIVGYSLLAVIAVHVAAALKHHIVDRDDTLRRMLPRRRG